MSERTKISLAMAVYNGERFIREQLDSFVSQTRLPDELVVSDNASTDRTVEIVRDFAARAPFPVRLFINDSNLGVTANFERAISECTGDVIFLSDCDDVWYPEKIAAMELAFHQFPEAGVAICNAGLVDEGLASKGRTLWQAQRFSPSSRLRERLAGGWIYRRVPYWGCCMAFRADFRRLLLPMPRGAPHDFLIVHVILCSGAGGIALLPKPLVAYRQHSDQAAGAKDWGILKRLQRGWRGRKHQGWAAQFAALEERIASLPAPSDRRRAKVRVAALRHCRARCHLPRKKIARVPMVLRELVSLRYHRFGAGFLTCLRELLFVE